MVFYKEFEDVNNREVSKAYRILYIYDALKSEKLVNKSELSSKFNVDPKAIQRDILEIKDYLIDEYPNWEIEYSRKNKSYEINKDAIESLRKEEVLGITKILLESRAFSKEETNKIIIHLMEKLSEADKKTINKLIRNELFNYVPLKHNSELSNKVWDLSEFINKKEIIKITYEKQNHDLVERKIKPMAIIFSEYYFYIVGFMCKFDFKSPTVFRVDRIKDYKGMGEKFKIPEEKRFQEGEFRKRVQFMYTGNLTRIKFQFWGSSLEAILERLPTAKVIEKKDNKYTIKAEVFGKGVLMWLMTQGSKFKLLEPKEMVEELKEELKKMLELY